MNIAVLDDNLAILEYLETTLTLDAHRVSKYTVGTALLDAFFPKSSSPSPGFGEEYQIPFDLLILDLLLQGTLSGAEVFLTLRKTFSADELPIIVITAVDNATLEQFRQILPDDVPLLRKPFRPQELRTLISKLFQQ